MRFSKRTLAAAVAVASIAVASAAPAADAAYISADYCERSLRGQTGQAPDNDIWATWNVFVNQFGYAVYQSSSNPNGWWQQPELTRNDYWRFDTWNVGRVYANFVCWRSSDGVYHDSVR